MNGIWQKNLIDMSHLALNLDAINEIYHVQFKDGKVGYNSFRPN